MDTRLKSSNSKYIINSIILLMLIILSAGMYSTYPIIKEQAKNYEYNVFERSDFFSNLKNSNYCIYFDMLKNKENTTLKPSDVLLDVDKRINDYTPENMERAKNVFDEDIYRHQERLDANLKNLHYYAVKRDNNLIREKEQGELYTLLNDNPESSILEALNNKYSFYIVIEYNENGDMSIKRIYGSDKLVAIDRLKNNRIEISYSLETKPIKNMTYVYAVPKELQYQDLISNYENRNKINSYNDAASNFITPALIFILVVGLLIPYRITKELTGFYQLKKIPIEIIVFIFFFTLGVLCSEVSYSMISSTIAEDLVDFSLVGVSPEYNNILASIVNTLYWTVVFGIVFFISIIIRHIFATGIRQYLKENSLTYKILRSICRSHKNIFNYLRNVDLKKKEHKKIVTLLGINLIILTIMSCLWFFGIILAIIYSVVLFKVVTKHYDDISRKYNKLFEATNKIAEGNLEVNIEEDLGIFNAFKGELQSIQKGFKKAVHEEVKSQKMKTELITNVSHDLKTPLTSIITYVDLLKDEKLTEKKRREYLDTLDRKSQRLKDLIEDLFEVSRATSGNISLNIIEVDVVSLMKQTLLELGDKIAKASLAVKTSYPEEKVILPLDSQRMFRVFENLIINITKYAMEGTRVYIDVINRIDKVEITLKNMAANEISFNVNEIMERFVRGDKSRHTDGSGLGLAIAKSFVELQGGKLDINVDGDLFKVIITFYKG